MSKGVVMESFSERGRPGGSSGDEEGVLTRRWIDQATDLLQELCRESRLVSLEAKADELDEIRKKIKRRHPER